MRSVRFSCNRSASSQKFVSAENGEKGATLIEYVLVAAFVALIMMTGIPNVETSVESRIDAGANLWSTYDIAGI